MITIINFIAKSVIYCCITNHLKFRHKTNKSVDWLDGCSAVFHLSIWLYLPGRLT